MTQSLLGVGNGWSAYLLVLVVYGMLFILMRHANARVELSFRAAFTYLFVGWSLGTFTANYLLFRVGVMSFLPWLNNFLHTFVWIGLCLAFLYAGAYRKPLLEQFALFAIYSFIVKIAERSILGSWEHESFFGFGNNLTYIIGWSLLDGLYPVVSMVGLRLLSRVDHAVTPAIARA
jgi:hypothetical protein